MGLKLEQVEKLQYDIEETMKKYIDGKGNIRHWKVPRIAERIVKNCNLHIVSNNEVAVNYPPPPDRSTKKRKAWVGNLKFYKMKEYHKIQTVYFRDPENNHKTLLEGTWAKPEFELLKDINWICTEKIDGTNIRIMWDGESVRFGGKTDNAQIPAILIEVLQDTFTNEIMNECFPDADNVCLYGEGYGKEIQKGGNYLPDRADFILFDVKIGDWWLTREANEDIAKKLNIGVVPIIGIWKLEQAIEYVKNGFKSTIAENKEYVAEGLIMKPETELFNRRGERVIAKIKHKDFSR